MPYTQMPIVEVDLDELSLDLDNYRIPTRPADQGAAMRFLFAEEEVMEAALSILRDGYFDNEVPIVARESGRLVVLEGNRRVSALKVLQDPSLVPSHEREVRSLLRRFGTEAQNLPRRIRVLETSRDTAARHVARLHTGLSKRRWSLDQQATFYYSLLDAKTTVDDVRAQYPGVTIPRFIRMASVRRFLSAVRFEDHSLRDYAKSSELRMSSFEYAYRRDEIAAAVGIQFTTDGLLYPSTAKPEEIAGRISAQQFAALEFLVNEFRAKRLDTRSDAFKKGSEAGKQLVARLSGAPSPGTDGAMISSPPPAWSADANGPDGSSVSNGGTGAGGDAINPLRDAAAVRNEDAATEPNTSGTPAPEGRGPNRPDTKVRLNLAGVPYESAPVTLQKRFHELRGIHVGDFPIASAMLLRAVVESTIKFHYENKTNPVSGQLDTVMTRVQRDYGKVQSLRHAIETIKSGRAATPGSITWFNMVAHNGDFPVAATDIHRAWELVNPLVRHLLRP